ncbi:hypothetical protein HHK36_032633 [Tetracentron sinense]|uniref:Uncharacterized protein n=1 Tax=Tetracentron sinense TaxID=13715 RepID=A0A834Y9Y7_TETSI|nr:hypothetical protein HHK36_032633 [Tetracentron sinense]
MYIWWPSGADSAPAGSGTVFNVLPTVLRAGGKKDNTQADSYNLGTVIAPTDVSEFPSPEWFSFEKLDGLIVTGGGNFRRSRVPRLEIPTIARRVQIASFSQL